MIKTLKISLISIISSIFIVSCASTPNKTFLKLDGSQGFAGDISKAPDEKRAQDRAPLLKDEKTQTPILTSSNNQDGFDPFTLPLSLRSLDTGMPLVVNLGKSDETFNYNLREVKAFEPSVIGDIKRVDSFAHLSLEYIQFVSAKDINECLGIDESGFFMLKNCFADLNKKKFETVFQLIPLLSDTVEIRSLVLGGKECISTFFNPNLEPWQRVGILKCELREGFGIDTPRLWAIMPEIREATVLQPLD
ncbi:cytolethal distending toxin A/C family protein [Campylobacter hyointestinalis subsp. hyointestinalis]|uniref:Cytolethal distending toxin A/C family protein n=1 Tax=Campylobacter hyointestinalis subsp. hyointestinalis TaxID=91352 RepID=A0A9W5AUC3_CAMHY|nr:hypothetical protein [Campylobacter hyointestinalis]CUU70989.1 cytolethal distending toxin A/C family protein [Campylobacter hyointestinalis subsp. hyointestinalis]CUU71017.1 cytolethal distending toxin A/C family protein [Campylobacter hyointestinalis subsp. hyointestinalis]CUU85539.1 cytolethal distending toxin A/C family protein [Campylobacter hyointestinalis subsp. hyointestinalis]